MKIRHFKEEMRNWCDRVSKLPGADKHIDQFENGYITLNDLYQVLRNIELKTTEQPYTGDIFIAVDNASFFIQVGEGFNLSAEDKANGYTGYLYVDTYDRTHDNKIGGDILLMEKPLETTYGDMLNAVNDVFNFIDHADGLPENMENFNIRTIISSDQIMQSAEDFKNSTVIIKDTDLDGDSLREQILRSLIKSYALQVGSNTFKRYTGLELPDTDSGKKLEDFIDNYVSCLDTLDELNEVLAKFEEGK